MKPSLEESIFALAVTKPEAERAAFLDRECGTDAALRARLEVLLAVHEQPDTLLTTQVKAIRPTIKLDLADEPRDEAVGQTIGRYKLLERIGEGGCGVVYVAEQTEPVRRRVALKVIKLGMDTKAVVARFEAERQALAMMDHPNIAKVLDAGTTGADTAQSQISNLKSQIPGGRPFFVMELVRGIRITDYCDQNNLSTRDRLDLFIKVCQAIQHAHQKGIIHRDIKPSNILVTLHDGVPVPKVIDFGIAKATEGRLADATVYTQLHQFIGTPAYMSPEQAEMSGLDIDTRSDIYSLGVLLYELLTGKTPFDAKELMSRGIDAMRLMIREKEPVRPSTRFATLKGEELTTTAKRRSSDAPRLITLLRGDLDWIVMKCLEKDRTRRYETANGLAMDLKRHIENEPVVARPPSTAYRLQKAWKRNKLIYGATAAVMLALAAGFGMAAAGWRQVGKERDSALMARAGEETQRLEAQLKQAEAEAERRRADAEARNAAESERHARQLLYAADMNLVQQALKVSNLGRARDLLYRNVPSPGVEDLRGWEWRYSWQLCQSDELFTFLRHTNSIYKLALSPNGNLMAFGSGPGEVQLWDLREQRRILNLQTNGGISVAAFSPAGDQLATADQRNTLTLWDTATWRPLSTFTNAGLIRTIHYSRDGGRLLTYGREGILRIWETSSPHRVRLHSLGFRGGTGNIHHGDAVFTPDGGRIVVGDPRGRIQVLDAGTFAMLHEFKHPVEGITSLAISPDGRHIAAGSGYSSYAVHVWELDSGRLVKSIEGHRGWVPMLAFSPDGHCLASTSADQTVRLWDTGNWENLATFQGHTLEVWSLAFTPDGSRLITGSKDGEIKVWDPSSRPRSSAFQTFSGTSRGPFKAALASDGMEMFYIDAAGQVKRLALEPNRPPEPVEGRWTTATSVSTSKQGDLLAVGDGNGRIHVGRQGGVEPWSLLGEDTEQWMPILFDETGRRLVAVQWEGSEGAVFDVQTGLLLHRWNVATNDTAVAFARSGNRIIIGFAGGRINVMDPFTGSVEFDLMAPGERTSSFAFDAKSGLLAVGSEYGTTTLWNTADGSLVEVLKGHLKGVHSVAFSPDGKRLLTLSGEDETVKIWDVATRQEVATLPASGSLFGDTRLSDDGNTITTINWLGDLHVWRAPTWEEIDLAEARRGTIGRRRP